MIFLFKTNINTNQNYICKSCQENVMKEHYKCQRCGSYDCDIICGNKITYSNENNVKCINCGKK